MRQDSPESAAALAVMHTCIDDLTPASIGVGVSYGCLDLDVVGYFAERSPRTIGSATS